MVYEVLDRSDPNFRDYTIKISRTDRELIEAVKGLIAEGRRIYRDEVQDLPNVHFDRHLYQPLLIERGDRIKTEPQGLKESEQRFVKDLRQYFRDQAATALADHEIFLLRNLTRGKGIGFFQNEGFYPDFILWIKRGDAQRIVFVEPHGMRQEKAYWASGKAQLHERLQELSNAWGRKAGLKNVVLDSFIISATSYDDLREYCGESNWTIQDFADKHILFFEPRPGYTYVSHLFDGSG